MELTQIRHFLAIAEAGSFSAAVGVAFATQPALSASIAKLEADLGVPLFVRGARGIALTEAGERFLVRCRGILREVEAARASLRGAPAGGRARFGLSTSVPAPRVAGMLTRLGTALAPLTLGIREGTAAQIGEWLLAGRLDAAITRSVGPPAAGLAERLLFEDRQVLAVPTSGSWARYRHADPRMLDGEPLIVRIHCEDMARASRILDRLKVRPKIVLRTDRDDVALAMVAAGLGACLMPDSFSHPGVRMLQSPTVRLARKVVLVWRRDALGGRLDAAFAKAI